MVDVVKLPSEHEQIVNNTKIYKKPYDPIAVRISAGQVHKAPISYIGYRGDEKEVLAALEEITAAFKKYVELGEYVKEAE